MQTTLDDTYWDKIVDIDNTLNFIDFSIQLKHWGHFSFHLYSASFYEIMFTMGEKKEHQGKYQLNFMRVSVLFSEENVLDMCHLQRHWNSGQLMIVAYAELPYTIMQLLLVHHTSAPAKEKNGVWNPALFHLPTWPPKERDSFFNLHKSTVWTNRSHLPCARNRLEALWWLYLRCYKTHRKYLLIYPC